MKHDKCPTCGAPATFEWQGLELVAESGDETLASKVYKYAPASTPPVSAREDVIDFGDYISVEQHRYGADNEFYIHKVIGTLKSNKWMDVPAINHNGMTLHDHMEEVVNCICCGVSETEVIRYRIKDVKKIKYPHTAPTN